MLVVALAVFRILTVLLFATGMGALATAATSFLFGSRASAGGAWIADVTTLGVEVAAIALAAVVLSARRMPSIAEIRRRIAPPEPNHPAQTVLLTGLAIGAVLQVPVLLGWFRADHALLLEMLGTEPDPLRLDLVPAALLYSLPTLAA